jgi:hypothetical protein
VILGQRLIQEIHIFVFCQQKCVLVTYTMMLINPKVSRFMAKDEEKNIYSFVIFDGCNVNPPKICICRNMQNMQEKKVQQVSDAEKNTKKRQKTTTFKTAK